MGFTIKGEERTPTFETVQVYSYDEALDSSTSIHSGDADYDESLEKKQNLVEKREQEEERPRIDEAHEGLIVSDKRVDSPPMDWIEANVVYDIYIESPNHEDPYYVARPGTLYKISKEIMFDTSLKGCIIYYGDKRFEIDRDVCRIITQYVEKKKNKKKKKYIDFYLDDDDTSIFRAECQ